MKNILLFRKAILLSTLLLITSFCFAQVKEQWVRKYHGTASGAYEAKDLAVDAKGNVYVTGQGGGDYVTVKYDAAGKELWVSTYNNVEEGFTDVATDIAVDAWSNVYVTGYSADFDGIYDYATIKYDANGKQQWVRRYGESLGFPDVPSAIAVDAMGNVYVTGSSYGGDFTFDYATIKYDTNGNELWIKRYSGEDITSNEAFALAVDAQGNVYVTGSSNFNDGKLKDIVTLKYDASGNQVWVRRYDGGFHHDGMYGNDFPTDLAVDGKGNVYVTGAVDGPKTALNYITIKYNASGDELWASRYSPAEFSEGRANAVDVDASGNVYVTGNHSRGSSGYDYETVKYNADGGLLWAKTYNGPADYDDVPNDMALDANGNVYVTGTSLGIGADLSHYYDFATVKYDTNGNELWVKRYEGANNNDDYGRGLAVDLLGNVYVTGSSGKDYATIKYSQVAGEVVTSFTLVDAGADQDIRALKDGDTINLAALSAKQLNIRANASSARSVVFTLSGKRTYSRTENGKPYALFGDEEGDYYSASLQPGDYTLMATPYSDYRGGGVQGTALTIHFHVLYQEVSSFTLVNATTDQDIRVLKEGDVIDLSALGGVQLNVRANTKPAKVGSVVFAGGFGAQSEVRTENQPPYAVLGDVEGNYNGAVPVVGEYTLTATPYSGYRGSGQKGTGKTIHFKVVDSKLNSITRGSDLQLMMERSDDFKVTVAPNPMSTSSKVLYQLPVDGQVSIKVYDVIGREVASVVQGARKVGIYSTELSAAHLAKGVYYYKALFTGGQKTFSQTGKLMVVK